VQVIKQTDPRGRDASFPYTTTLPVGAAVAETACNGGHVAIVAGAAGQPNTFSLNDKDNASKTAGSTSCANNSAGNTAFAANVPQGTYTVTEGAEPSTYGFKNVKCVGGEFGAGGTTSTSKTVTVHLQPNDAVVCLYTNELLTGSLKILKNSTKSGTAVLNAGAEFCYATTVDCSTTNVTDNGTGDSNTTTGVVCVANVTVGTYKINETKPPAGYGSSTTAANQSVTVAAGTNCTDNLPGTGATATLADPPLADIQVRFRDGGSGETALDGGDAGLTCDNATGTSSRADTTSWDDSLTVSGVNAGSSVVTVVCTIKIDP
jgi:hypothetical protein